MRVSSAAIILMNDSAPPQTCRTMVPLMDTQIDRDRLSVLTGAYCSPWRFHDCWTCRAGNGLDDSA